jgi:hypothetical protein
MTKSISIASRALLAMKPASKNIAWMLGGVAISAVVAVSAQQLSQATATPEPCALTDAMQAALNDKIRIIGLTSPDPSKYYTVGGADSCLGDFAVANLDLSRLIPDPLGILTDAVVSGVTKLANAAISTACKAARKSFDSTIGQYNAAVGTVSGDSNAIIDKSIGAQVEKSMTSYGLDYNAPKVNIADPIGNVKVNAPTLTLPNTSGNSTVNAVSSNATTAAVPSATAKPATVGSSIWGTN